MSNRVVLVSYDRVHSAADLTRSCQASLADLQIGIAGAYQPSNSDNVTAMSR